ncbi:tetraacyldisaccharide 4'-kinase [Flavobacterium coralii]|uniref:tetraacyldisaccharide 4'-kinase n=1 Tax=Flavobacterium coralii TaxID=2838017 RepID=UPI001F01C49E|nr:tetraacyldisaccharide 4'-kinase [Flavobacterium coralii]
MRKILLPFSLIYLFITAIRNVLYNKGIFKSYSFPLPVIVIGNLSTGGTGKSPMTEYLIRLLKDNYQLATLSRGYKRKTTGFVLADSKATAQTIGDEPYQFYTKFSDITVAVDADRVNGVNKLLSMNNRPDVIVLDDAYQHRRLKAGFYILLTAYSDLYADDYLLPAGNLRESRAGAKRADVIVVTKCPLGLTPNEQEAVIKKLKPIKGQKVFFSFIGYDDHVYSEAGKIAVNEVKEKSKILVAGIAKPKPFFEYVKGNDDIIKPYPDHHDFTEKEIAELTALADNRIIITTEKDYMRLKGKIPAGKLYYLPIKTVFLNNSGQFDKTILDYVGKSTANSRIH